MNKFYLLILIVSLQISATAQNAKTSSKQVDHSKFEILQKEFKSPMDVTEACLTCHNSRHIEIMNSPHWTWSRKSFVPGRGKEMTKGKINLINNFCTGIAGSEGTCTKCHIGYGWTDEISKSDINLSLLDYAEKHKNRIDCLVCHDNTGKYKKAKGKSGYPQKSVNLNLVAQNIGRPGKENCGSCHFYSGGGNNVKHGDLEKAQLNCTKEVDIHMAKDGVNLECVDCHTTENHNITGKLYTVSSTNENRSTCVQCHSDKPHEDNLLNAHFAKVACQTCHIPTYAKANATKTYWDWSTAGKLNEDDEPYQVKDSDGNKSYLSIKGTFEWGTNLKPEYVWFNGTADHYLFGDKIDPENIPVQINTLHGSYEDSENSVSKIIPVKVHRGKQIYDPVNMIIIQPKLWDKEKGKGAFWKDFDWHRAAEEGMKVVNLPYSGKYDFIETEMYWPVNHMVASADQALQCKSCHTPDNGRLAKLTDFYLPGRDNNPLVDFFGYIIIFGTITGVFVHTILRVTLKRKYKNISG